MAYEFKMTRRVEFSDTDAAGILHFANFFRYMEAVEHAFYRSLGFSVHQQSGGTMNGWPRVAASCSFREPLRFEEVVQIHLRVLEKTEKTVRFGFVFCRSADGGPEDASQEVARGELTVIYATKGEQDDRLRAASIPPHVASRIEVAPPQAGA